MKDLKDIKDSKEVLTNLMSAVDVKNFGATFAEAKIIFNYWSCSIWSGINKYEDTTAEEQQILSPFRDGSKDSQNTEEAKNSTLGTRSQVMKHIIFYPFCGKSDGLSRIGQAWCKLKDIQKRIIRILSGQLWLQRLLLLRMRKRAVKMSLLFW